MDLGDLNLGKLTVMQDGEFQALLLQRAEPGQNVGRVNTAGLFKPPRIPLKRARLAGSQRNGRKGRRECGSG